MLDVRIIRALQDKIEALTAEKIRLEYSTGKGHTPDIAGIIKDTKYETAKNLIQSRFNKNE